MFNPEQIKELLDNKNVDKCSPTSITYSKKFKIKAVKQYYDEGYSPSMIFEEAGFNPVVMGQDRMKTSLFRWKRIYRTKGENELNKDNRGKHGSGGRKPNMKFKNKDEEIEYLKAKIAYTDAENDFLAKLRGLKRK